MLHVLLSRCGPARHASLLQNKTGSVAVALDKSKAMLAYAKDVAAGVGASVHFMHADMKQFQLQVMLYQQLVVTCCLVQMQGSGSIVSTDPLVFV